jgi:hypothetical protein
VDSAPPSASVVCFKRTAKAILPQTSGDKVAGHAGFTPPLPPLCKGGKALRLKSKSQEPSRGAGVLSRLFQVVGRCRCGLIDIQEESLAAIFL